MERLSLSQRTKVYITFGASVWLVVLGLFFLVLNGSQGRVGLAGVNLSTTTLGAVSFLLLSRRLYTYAAAVMTVGCGFCFSISGYLFQNGMEYTLLLGMMGGVLMFDSRVGRILVAGLNGFAFLVVKLLLYHPTSSGEFPLIRYGLNLAIFVGCYFSILMIFRAINSYHRSELEAKNWELAQSQEKLDKEHAVLMATTAELEAANRAKEKLFTIVAHDLRGPVGNLKMTVNLLREGSLTPEDFRDVLVELEGEVDHAYDCLDTLLTWSASQLKAIQPVFAEVSLLQVAKRSIALLSEVAARKQIGLSLAIPPEAVVRVDENQLDAILRNLISNALKFTPAGGAVIVSALKEETAWWVRVADNGIGMAPDRVDQLLESRGISSTSGTANEKGLGLGLQICFEFVEGNGGKLHIESRLGEGSLFSFKLKDAVIHPIQVGV